MHIPKGTKIIEASLQVGASAIFSIVKPEGWDKWSQRKKLDYFMDNCTTNAGLCHQCSRGFDCDMEFSLDIKPKDVEYYEEVK